MSAGLKRTSFALVTALVWLSAGTAVLACPVCFQVEESAAVNGVRAAVLVLAGVTGGVLLGFAIFVRRVAKRSKAAQS
jgi:hypothetical protein